MRKKQLKRELDAREQEVENLLDLLLDTADEVQRLTWRVRLAETQIEVERLQADVRVRAALQPDIASFPVAAPGEDA